MSNKDSIPPPHQHSPLPTPPLDGLLEQIAQNGLSIKFAPDELEKIGEIVEEGIEKRLRELRIEELIADVKKLLAEIADSM